MKMKNKVVYCGCYGGYGIPEEGFQWLKQAQVEDPEALPRHHPLLIAMVKKFGKINKMGDFCYGSLYIAEIYGRKYWIEEYDGSEEVHTPSSIEWIKIE